MKESKIKFLATTQVLTDAGYLGITKIHANSKLPKKNIKKYPLTKEDKLENKKLSSQRVLNENVIGMLKRFKIITDKYRNRRKRFGLRFNLIAGIYNYELMRWGVEGGIVLVYLLCEDLLLVIEMIIYVPMYKSSYNNSLW